jgi:hypothetical protein
MRGHRAVAATMAVLIVAGAGCSGGVTRRAAHRPARPAGTTLYVSAYGGRAGGVILEYDARTGRRLAAASGVPIRYALAGAELTAVPGGVWASFRTGMEGLTIHLGAPGLRMTTPPRRCLGGGAAGPP